MTLPWGSFVASALAEIILPYSDRPVRRVRRVGGRAAGSGATEQYPYNSNPQRSSYVRNKHPDWISGEDH